jgi:threonine/homoserine/homoserine lactone efflux protein
MVASGLLVGAASAAAVSTLTPGPAFLSLLGIGATQGRRPAAWFILGHLAGDIAWSLLAMAAIIGSGALGPLVFNLLGIVCAAYLFWIGIKAATARRNSDGTLSISARRPLRRGIAFGLTNPKGYPVAIALFTALLAGHGALTWNMLPALELAAIVGFLAADIVVIMLVGMNWVRRVFSRHELVVSRIFGLVFIGFAVDVARDSLPGLLQRGLRTFASLAAAE